MNTHTLTSVITKIHGSGPTAIKMLNAGGVSPTSKFHMLSNTMHGLLLVGNTFVPDDSKIIITAINEESEAPKVCVIVKPRNVKQP